MRVKKWWVSLAVAGVVVLIAIATVIVQWERPGRPGPTVWVTIPMGAGSRGIAQVLADQHIIDNPFWFRVYLAFSGKESDLQAGTYPFHGGMTIAQVVDELRMGATQYNTLRVTIPEGYTIEQIAPLLAKKGICTTKSFYRALREGTFSYPFMHQIPKQGGMRYRLEGYLFPDTYDFLRGEPAHDVINTMLAETNQILTPSFLHAIVREGLTQQQFMTIASMVVKEATLRRELPLVASVIFNRLHAHPPMKLQIDATTVYAMHGDTHITPNDLAVPGPYNTYTHLGLPPGPIANPGLAAMLATLHPAHTDYLYYVARNDGSGGQYFASTYAQQLRDIAKSNANQYKH